MAPQGDSEMIMENISFTINGKVYTVDSTIPPTTTLVDYIRDVAHLSGTKVLCREAGCGVCTIVATSLDPETNNPRTFSVRSCQTLVYACAGWSIETIESLGNRYSKYHPLEQALHTYYGTQCGYCSPGFIMTMYGELKSKGKLKKDEIERALDGNICRCTGYRPIIEAFKSQAGDAPQELRDKYTDIEDIDKEICPKSGSPCSGKCDHGSADTCSSKLVETSALPPASDDFKIIFGAAKWYRPVTIKGIYNVLTPLKPEDKVRIVVGNTGAGVFKNDGPYNIYINTSGIKEFYDVTQGSNLILGANVSLARAMDAFKTAATSMTGFKHLDELVKHWSVVANVAVRNIGSWAGNLMMKHDHPEFPSDIFLTLLAVDATIKIGHSTDSSTSTHTLIDFLKLDMSKSIILSITIPKQPENTILRTFKITPRTVNAHAYVNAAFKFRVDPADNYKLISKPTILYGGINKDFIHAYETENYLASVKLYNRGVLFKAVTTLGEEIKPHENHADASAEYRTSLAQALFYKTVVGILGSAKVSPEYFSAGANLERGQSSGQQSFDENTDTWPIGQPVRKLESNIQISGEAEYVDDVEPLHDELEGAFVQTTVANATIASVDESEALKVPGVVAYIDAKDIAGLNSYVVNAGPFADPVFATVKSNYAGQPVGLIVAKNKAIAKTAAKLVKVTYKDAKKPVLTIREALKVTEDEPTEILIGDLEEATKNAKNIIEGEFDQGTQFHMPMEPHSSRVVPMEDGYDVLTTTQWPTEASASMAQVLKISNNRINLSVRRLGGAYGSKISRGHVVLCAAAVAAQKLQRPVRITLDLNSHMTIAGWREPYYSKYKVGFDDDGKMQFCDVLFVGDAGHVSNESAAKFAVFVIRNCYYCPAWKLSAKVVNTDTAANTYCRTPGHVEAMATIESIMEHIAVHLNKDPLAVREINFITDQSPSDGFPGPKGPNLLKSKLLPLIQDRAMIQSRQQEIDDFNIKNRWNKKGLSIIPMYYGFDYPGVFRYSVQVVIYVDDGTVAISHGGIEMGQGINVKVAQVAARTLGVTVDMIKVKPTNVFVGANSAVTGGSFGSDLVSHGAKICCEKLRERIDPVYNTMDKPDWQTLVKKCDQMDVDLSERYYTRTAEHPGGYDIWGVMCTEVALDVLTGQYIITRTDVVEDCGRSLNPYVDIGQIEGSIVMGFGMYTSELVKFNPDTGEKLSNGTWEYKPPTALDIPVDFRVIILPNGDNKSGVVRSKASGEPPLCLSYSVVTALRQAITSARKDAGVTGWFQIDTPLTVEKVQLLCKNNPAQYILKKKKVDDNDDEIDAEDFEIVDDSKADLHDSKNCSIN